MDQDPQINNAIYDDYGEKWYTAEDDPVALLRAEHRLQLPWIVDRMKEQDLPEAKVLDIGCGAGLLSNELAKKNFKVTGVDVSQQSLEVARRHDETSTVHYEVADAYHLPFPNESFDFVTAMDFLEHVDDPERVIEEISRVLKPHGLFFFHTFNRNFLSWLFVIKAVETLVKNTPKDMHVLPLFIRPRELERYCHHFGMEVLEMTGIKPVLSSITWKMIRTGTISDEFEFETTKSRLLSYMGVAKKRFH